MTGPENSVVHADPLKSRLSEMLSDCRVTTERSLLNCRRRHQIEDLQSNIPWNHLKSLSRSASLNPEVVCVCSPRWGILSAWPKTRPFLLTWCCCRQIVQMAPVTSPQPALTERPTLRYVCVGVCVWDWWQIVLGVNGFVVEEHCNQTRSNARKRTSCCVCKWCN